MSSGFLHPHARGRGMASARSRARLIDRLRGLAVAREQVLDAMEATPRHFFVDEAMASRAYDDTALPIGYGQTISQPFIVAQMLELLLGDGERPASVLEIGTGSGYQAAVVSRLVDSVYTVERVEALVRLARRRLSQLGCRNVRVRPARDDVLGLPGYGPFDGIVVAAGAETMPVSLYEQMNNGARMVVPVGPDGRQSLVVVTRNGNEFQQEALEAVSFVPLVNG